MKIVGIIPARYASTRFPGKPLVDIAGKTMIERVYQQSCKSELLHQVVVATDDPRIYDAVKGFNGNVVMTSSDHLNGTERCCEVAEKLLADFYINIQGDEPFIKPAQIDALASILNKRVEIATLIKQIEDPTQVENPNVVKVVRSVQSQALYFSRAPIPFVRDLKKDEGPLDRFQFWKHIGIYAYRRDVLKKIVKLPPSNLETAESLEQLRWIENGFKIEVAETKYESHGVDTPEDLVKHLNQLSIG